MKKTIGICLFAAVLFACAGVFLLFGDENQAAPEEELPITVVESSEEYIATEEPLLTESMKIQTDCLYILREENGVLIVYEGDGKTVLLETNIKIKHLPKATQDRLSEGIRVSDERELYDLLESYSS